MSRPRQRNNHNTPLWLATQLTRKSYEKMFLAVEGLIGAGKTTLARWMADRAGWMFLEEPVDGNAVLERFYEEPKRYAFPLQIAMLHHRYRQQQVAGHSHRPCVMDRSLPADRVFAQLQTKYENMTPIEMAVYEDCYRSMTAARPPFLMIFLEVDPEVALERVHKRARFMESGLTLQYLRDLDAGYDDMLASIEQGSHPWSRGIKVLRVPWNGSYEDLNNSPAEDILGTARRYLADP